MIEFMRKPRYSNAFMVAFVVAGWMLDAVFSRNCQAAELEINGGVITTDIYEQSYLGNIKWGAEHVYGWMQYEEGGSRWYGQEISSGTILSGGVGAREKFGRITAFIEAGYAMTDFDIKSEAIRDEMVPTWLIKNHQWDTDLEGRPAPAITPSEDNDSKTSYEMGDGWIGRIGASVALWRGAQLTGAYRYLVVEEHYEWWDQSQRDAGKGWWQETEPARLSGWEITIGWKF